MRNLIAVICVSLCLTGCTSLSLDECRTTYAATLSADVLTTHIAVQRGLTEANTLHPKKNPEASVFLSGLLVPAFAETFNLIGKPEWAKTFYVVGSYIRGATAVWNIGQITTQKPEVKK